MARPAFSLLIGIALLSGMLAGCLQGDDPEPAGPSDNQPQEEVREPQVADEARADVDMGSLRGRIMDDGLDPLNRTEIWLQDDAGGETLRETLTDTGGYYTFNDLEPGDYRLVITHTCCFTDAKLVTVKPGEITEHDFILERISARNIRVAQIEGPYRQEGFLGCGFSVNAGPLNPNWSLCDLDPNQNIHFHEEAGPGLFTLIVALEWESSLPMDNELKLMLMYQDSPNLQSFHEETGPSGMVVRVDRDDLDEEDRFSEEEGNAFRFRVIAGDGTGIVFQQPFTIYHSFHYWDNAPEGYDPIAQWMEG